MVGAAFRLMPCAKGIRLASVLPVRCSHDTYPMHAMNTRLPRIGILGGMGPLATADFFAKLTRATPATRDQDHFPVTLESAPQIPDRVAAMQGYGEDVLPALRAVAQRLVDHVFPPLPVRQWVLAVPKAAPLPSARHGPARHGAAHFPVRGGTLPART